MDKMIKTFESEIKGIDEKERTIVALVSTATADRMGESLNPDGADLTNFKKNPIVLFAHNYTMPPIGKALWIKKTAEGIMSKVQFASTQMAQEIFELYKGGFMRAFSVGFLPDVKHIEDFPDEKCNDGKKKPKRRFNKWELLEYSCVPVPANPEALSLAMSKGMIKDETLKIMIDEQLWNEDSEVKVIEECKEIKDETKKPNLEDITSELKLKDDIITKQQQEISDLKYKLYEKKTDKPTIRTVSDMTVDEIQNIIMNTVDGVIREITGKVKGIKK